MVTNLEESFSLSGVSVVEVLLPLDEGLLLDHLQIVHVSKETEEQALGPLLPVAEYLKRVD